MNKMNQEFNRFSFRSQLPRPLPPPPPLAVHPKDPQRTHHDGPMNLHIMMGEEERNIKTPDLALEPLSYPVQRLLHFEGSCPQDTDFLLEEHCHIVSGWSFNCSREDGSAAMSRSGKGTTPLAILQPWQSGPTLRRLRPRGSRT